MTKKQIKQRLLDICAGAQLYWNGFDWDFHHISCIADAVNGVIKVFELEGTDIEYASYLGAWFDSPDDAVDEIYKQLTERKCSD